MASADLNPFDFTPVSPGMATAGQNPYQVQAEPQLGPFGTPGATLYGAKPGRVENPSPYTDLTKILPSLPNLNLAASGALGHELSGDVDTNYLRNLAANLGITTGVGGAGGATPSGFVNNSMLVNGMLYRDKLQQQGLSDYGRLIPTIAQTQTLSPALQLENAWWNTTNAAAPDPAAQGFKSDMMQIIGGVLGGI